MPDPVRAGPKYRYAGAASAPTARQATPYDNIPVTPVPEDPGYQKPQNPDGSEIGPLSVSPEGQRWVDEHVWTPGYTIDWKSREVIDPESGKVIETVPTSVPRMT